MNTSKPPMAPTLLTAKLRKHLDALETTITVQAIHREHASDRSQLHEATEELRRWRENGVDSMKRASYRQAVRWIAENDDPGDDEADNVDAVAEMISVLLTADIFGVEPKRVAADVVRKREQINASAAV